MSANIRLNLFTFIGSSFSDDKMIFFLQATLYIQIIKADIIARFWQIFTSYNVMINSDQSRRRPSPNPAPPPLP